MSTAIWVFGGVLAMLVLVFGALVLFTVRTARRVEHAVPPIGRFIDVDGGRIHYVDEGVGQPLLCLHGLAGQMRDFTHSLRDRLTRDYRIVIIDRPGSGYSTRPPQASAAIRDQAETIARFAEAIGLKRALVVGHSLGGAIALSLALNHPDLVAGLALIAPATHPPEHVPAPFGGLDIASPLLRWLVAWTVATPLSMANREFALNTVFGPQPVARDYPTRGGGLLNLRPSAFIAASRDLVEARQKLDDMTARYGSLKVPLGILYGTADRVLDATEQGEALAAMVPGADCELIEGGGHMIHIASADRCAAFIARIAQRVGA